ncbi:MAG: AMP-binding protein [Candidatus Electrothrix aestuarii]|uniref:AMP-binding protein n=1 Tax=Candidatus Electrothrix aestuarii TaxID=3062594 RepID=A0AAU8LUI8_9BACT|nr:AMP-binding protein [Candidatus Electrothrix aestuarii]
MLYIESPTFEKNRQYWLEQYRNIPEPLFTRRYYSQFSGRIAGSGCETLYLNRAFYGQLEELAKKYKATLFHVLLGALYVYLTRTGQRDNLPVGLPVLNRSKACFRETAGLFVGVSPVLFDFGNDLSFGELLRRIAKILRAGYRHQRCPVSEISRAAGLDRERAQLFGVNLSFERHDYNACFAGTDGRFTALLHTWEQTPLMIFVRDFHTQEDVKFDFVFNHAYFTAEDIRALQARFASILKTVHEQDAAPVRSLPLLTAAETKQLIAWNDTTVDYPADKTLADLFEEQAAKSPENIAVVFPSAGSGRAEDQRLTYCELNEKANQLAHALIEQGVRPDTLIAICAERSLEMIIGLLGILKAGGAYVPLDPDYLEERLRFMLKDCGAEILLTQTRLYDRLPGFTGKMIDLDEPQLYAGWTTENPQRCCRPKHLAYVIYTSGSTGRPKGVMVEHCHVLV